MADIFKNQKLTTTLTAKDNDGDVINLTGRTVHFLTRDPDGTITTDESPTISEPSTGICVHVYAANALDQAGDWMDKLLIDTVVVLSTRHIFHVYERWER